MRAAVAALASLLVLAPIAVSAQTIAAPGITLPVGQTITFVPDNTYDIGASGATRPRNLYLGGTITSAQSVTALGGVFVTQGSKLGDIADGSWRISKANGTQPTVATLGTCSSANDGARSFVTDSSVTTFATAVAGAGTSHVPVYCDGSGTPTWKVG